MQHNVTIVESLSFILTNSKFSNLQKLSVASINSSFLSSTDVPLEYEGQPKKEAKKRSERPRKQLKSGKANYTVMSADKLNVFPQLTHLNLMGHSTLTTEEFVKIIPCFPALKMLVLTGCAELTQPKVITEALAMYCPNLEMISVDITPIPYVSH